MLFVMPNILFRVVKLGICKNCKKCKCNFSYFLLQFLHEESIYWKSLWLQNTVYYRKKYITRDKKQHKSL